MKNYCGDIINLVHYYLLKRYEFRMICSILGLNTDELLYYIRCLNETNNTKISVVFSKTGYPSIPYSKSSYVTHYFESSKKKIQIMLVGDKHIGHMNDRLGYICEIYEYAEKRGIDYIFDLGDILNGPSESEHKNSSNKTKVQAGTLDGSLERLVRYHPSNIPTYFITGNHDLRFMMSDGCDIGKLIESECKNMTFLNNLFTLVDINGIRINLSHGSIENKKLASIKLDKEYKFLKINNPFIICQAHFHVGVDRAKDNSFNPSSLLDNDGHLLCQVPSLKSSTKSGFTRNKKLDMGATILTFRDYGNFYELCDYEEIVYSEEKHIIRSETSSNKTRIRFRS